MQGHVNYFSHCCEREEEQLIGGRVCLLLQFKKKGHSPLGQGRQCSQSLRQRVVLLLETGNREGWILVLGSLFPSDSVWNSSLQGWLELTFREGVFLLLLNLSGSTLSYLQNCIYAVVLNPVKWMIKINHCKGEQGLPALQTPQKSHLCGLLFPCLIVSVCVLSLEIIERACVKQGIS